MKAESIFNQYFNYIPGSIPRFRGKWMQAELMFKTNQIDKGLSICKDVMNDENQ